jgi:hypothetical protein
VTVTQPLAGSARLVAPPTDQADFVLLTSTPLVVVTGVAAEFLRPNSSPPTSRGIPAYLLLSTLRV